MFVMLRSVALKKLTADNNQFSGPIPGSFGDGSKIHE